MTHHPIRDLPILVYTGEDDCVAFIGDGSRYSFPYFRGPDYDAAFNRAEAFVQKVLAENEAAFIARQEAAQKARATKAAKVAR